MIVNASGDTDAIALTRGGGAVSVSDLQPVAVAGGATRAYADDGLDISSSSLALNAHGDARADGWRRIP